MRWVLPRKQAQRKLLIQGYMSDTEGAERSRIQIHTCIESPDLNHHV